MIGYPEGGRARNLWVRRLRPARLGLEEHPPSVLVEAEPCEGGRTVEVATVFLSNRECPWSCVMCDLWKHALPRRSPSGAVAAQVEEGVAAVPACPWIKLYNAGSLFDEAAIRPAERNAIARAVGQFERVIVECHPALVGPSVSDFAARLGGRLEVAMGLETACEETLAKLNKGVTLDGFARAVAYLRRHGVEARAFVLLPPPFMTRAAGLESAARSAVFAESCGVRLTVIIPTRSGNGSLDALARVGQFEAPDVRLLEAALERAQACCCTSLVLADLWDVDALAACPVCLEARCERLRRMNCGQRPTPPVSCAACDHGAAAGGDPF